MSKLSSRPIVEHFLPLSKTIRILHPEQVVLRIGGKSIDVGALCYLRRSVNVREITHQYRKVDLTSLCHERLSSVRALIDFFSEQVEFSGKRMETLHSYFSGFINPFMSWADGNNYTQVLDNKEQARDAFKGYVAYLKDRVGRNEISINTAAASQSFPLNILSEFLEIEDLTQGINLIRYSVNAIESTSPPCEITQSKQLSLSESLFIGFSKLVLENKPYPFNLKLPEYLRWENNFLWIFPLNEWCKPPHKYLNDRKIKKNCAAYDYINGRIANLDDIIQLYKNRDIAIRSHNSAKKQLFLANSNPQHYSRRNAAMLAVNAFIQLFFANTGMNLAQLIDLKWSHDYEVSAERQGFRAVKWRAAGRQYHIEITTSFLPQFKRYLNLRKYLLDGVSCEYLFFDFSQNESTSYNKKNTSVLQHLNRSYQIIDPQIPSIMSKGWRAAKSDWLIKNTDIATTAIILNNSEKVVAKHYAKGSEADHFEELSTFFNSIAETVVNRGQVIVNGIESVVGVCSSFGAPHQLYCNIPVIPDCRIPEGCLFCDKYKVHADERDVRKLLSCSYCIQYSSHLATNEEQFQALFSTTLTRIQEIINEIIRKDESMVKRIESEVKNGELDPYWSSKLEMLLELESVL